jgi:ABC-2 type transport system ATP-binding protein
VIELRSVTKDFGELRAVDDLNLKLSGGSIFGLLGPNGAGKSTTIRMILNIIAPDSGEILFEGRALKDEDRRRIGYLPEERGLYPKMKCAETLEYFARLKGRPKDRSLAADISRWLERFDLGDCAGRRIEDLSKGMAQKIQFIIALIHDPDLLILDEPFSGLDPISQNLMLEVLGELQQRGRTVLFSTHIMDHAEKICDSICIINKGRTLASGALDDIRRDLGDNTVYIEGEGAFPDFSRMAGVKSVVSYPRSRELTLETGAESDAIFESLLGCVKVRAFERRSPSLHAVYSSLLGEAKDEN